VIRPHLAQGGIVLSDRYADSSLAYQGYGYRQDLDLLRVVTRFATGGLLPDLTLYFDLPVEIGLGRKAGGGGDAWNRMERKTIVFHERVRTGYLAMAAQEPSRWAVIDATDDFDSVQSIVREYVAKQHKLKANMEEGRVR
jgi:dTMP kinase